MHLFGFIIRIYHEAPSPECLLIWNVHFYHLPKTMLIFELYMTFVYYEVSADGCFIAQKMHGINYFCYD